MSRFVKIAFIGWLATAALPASDLSGIWTGSAPGRHGAKQDVAFQFRIKGTAIKGKMFGDEFDLPIEDASLTGNTVTFSVTITEYYSDVKTKFVYTGVIVDDTMELTRERPLPPGEKPPEDEDLKQTFTLKKLTS